MKPRILLFGGTAEGRALAEYCAAEGIPVLVSTATDYGGALLPVSPYVHILSGRMAFAEMVSLIRERGVKLVLDATHPFAEAVTVNIRAACTECGISYVRVLRESGTPADFGLYFDGIGDIVNYLREHNDGNILITTGSKALSAFCRLPDFAERCTVRVLAADGITESCVMLGFPQERIIAAKGPFTEEDNCRLLRQCGARYLVTKESGRAGGFTEKISAARQCGALPLIVRRPRESGVSLSEAKQLLHKERFHG